MSSPQYHIKLVRVECGEHWSMHDLRRTFTAAITSLNVHAFTIAHLMKHSTSSSMTLAYAPPTQEQLLEALIWLEQHLLERVRPEPVTLPHQRSRWLSHERALRSISERI